MDKVVYIPTRGRPANVLRTLSRWLGQGYAVRYVIEPRDYRAYRKAINNVQDAMDSSVGKNVHLDLLPDENRGIGYARNFCLNRAIAEGLETFVLSDDDVMPKAEIPSGSLDDFSRLHNAVTELGLFACSAVHSYQDFLTKGWLKKNRQYINSNGAGKFKHVDRVLGRPFFATSGSFHTCYAINTQIAVDLGGFDWRLNVAYEDNDLHIRAAKEGHIWAAHSGVWMDYIGKRFAPGGLADYAGIEDAVKAIQDAYPESKKEDTWYDKEYARCCDLIRQLHPECTSRPGVRMSFKWSKLWKDYFGDDWQKLSAIHGGNLPDIEGL